MQNLLESTKEFVESLKYTGKLERSFKFEKQVKACFEEIGLHRYNINRYKLERLAKKALKNYHLSKILVKHLMEHYPAELAELIQEDLISEPKKAAVSLMQRVLTSCGPEDSVGDYNANTHCRRAASVLLRPNGTSKGSHFTKGLCDLFIEYKPLLFKHFPSDFKTDELVQQAFARSPHAIEFLSNDQLTPETLTQTIDRDPSAYGRIPVDHTDRTLFDYAIQQSPFAIIHISDFKQLTNGRAKSALIEFEKKSDQLIEQLNNGEIKVNNLYTFFKAIHDKLDFDQSNKLKSLDYQSTVRLHALIDQMVELNQRNGPHDAGNLFPELRADIHQFTKHILLKESVRVHKDQSGPANPSK